MARYSIADVEHGLPQLIDRAVAGGEVIISLEGRPDVELRVVANAMRRSSSLEAIRALRDAGPRMNITSVELLRQMYEDRD